MSSLKRGFLSDVSARLRDDLRQLFNGVPYTL